MTPEEKLEWRGRLQGPTCRILDAMRWLESGRIPMPWHRSLVAYSANHLPRAGAFKGYVAKLKALEMISYPEAGGLALEQNGREVGIHPDQDESRDDFTREAYWQILDNHLGPMERSIIALVREEPLLRQTLFEAVHSHRDVAGFRNATAKLLAVGLIDIDGEVFCRTEVLFPLSVFERRLYAELTGSD